MNDKNQFFDINTNETQFDEGFLPLILWAQAFYQKQKDFIMSDAWQTWLIAGNGTGKTLILYWAAVAYAMGQHPNMPKRYIEKNTIVYINVLVLSYVPFLRVFLFNKKEYSKN